MWVTGPPASRGPYAGLALRWRRCPDRGWLAWTVYYIEADDTLVQQWVPAVMLTPVGALPASRA